MERLGSAWRLDILFTALTLTLGLQTLRAFFPLIVYVFGVRPGVTSMQMGLLAIAVFATAWLSAVPQWMVGPRRAVGFLAAALVLARVLAQFAAPDMMLWLAIAGTVAFLWTVPGLLVLARTAGSVGGLRLAVGWLLGIALDTVLAGAFWTWDPIWQRAPLPVLVTLAVALVYARVLRSARSWLGNPERADVSMGGALLLAGLGPVMLLHALIFQNVARLTAVTGWPQVLALLAVLAADAVAIVVALRVRSGPAAVIAAILLAPAAYIAHGTGPAAVLAWVIGTWLSAIVLTTILIRQTTGAPRPGLVRTATGWGIAMLLFAVPAFLYYVGYDLALPFENAALVPILALAAALAILPMMRAVPPPVIAARPHGLGRPALILLAVPLILWIWVRPPQAQPGTGWPVRVMSYNLHQGYGTDGAQNLEALAATIAASRADVIALQEVSRGWLINGSTEMLTWLSRRLQMPFVWGRAADAVWGNAILSRRPILASGHIEVPRGGVPMRRSALWAEIDLGAGQRLLVIGVHLHHVEADGHVRVPQAAALLDLWRQRPRAVVMGDLNATPDAREIAMLRDAGLRDAFVLAGQGDGFTYSAARPYQRIDYIWVSPDLSARDFVIMPGRASDHLGIAVTVGR
jgi:endonuclease/exonuclease/phosphatase family metal-dependent hydrolase